MFTGIIEEKGIVKNISISGVCSVVYIKAEKVMNGTKIGDSIAVNGVCLTVKSIQSDGFTADIMPETIRRSSFKELKRGSYVNLERAMAADGRFGGHIVSGHIDGTGVIESFKQEGNAVWISIKAKKEIMKLIVEKGSICIDGISLTVAQVSKNSFKVSIIPHTASKTNLINKKPGELVNLENDMVGKSVQKLLDKNECEDKNITWSLLSEYGF